MGFSNPLADSLASVFKSFATKAGLQRELVHVKFLVENFTVSECVSRGCLV